MVKRSKAERVAKAGARTAGSGLGAFFSNPIVAGITLLLGALLIFRKDITGAVSGFEFPKLPFSEIEFPSFDFKFPEFTFPEITFPEITFPEFPDFSGFFDFFKDKPIEDVSEKEFETEEGAKGMFGEGTTFDPNTGIIEGDKPPTIDLGLDPAGLDPLGEISFNRLKSQVFDTLTNLGQSPSQAFGLLKDVSFQDGFSALDKILQMFNTPFTPPDQPAQDLGFGTTVIQSLGTDQEFIGGGVGFQGGSVSPTPITTLTQVLNLFPQLTASQAADFLGEFSGILPEAALLQGGDVINLSGGGLDPPQIFNQTSLGISGTAEQIFKLLFPNVKSNF